MENINNQETISPGHLKELEGVLSNLLTNQEIIIDQNKSLLAAKKEERIWKIVKAFIFVLLVIVPLFFLPQIMSSLMEQMTSGLDIGNMVQGSGLNLDPEKLSELEKFLK